MTRRSTLPPDPEGMNAHRAAWAETAIDAFMTETRTEHGNAVSDLLADLMHLCDRGAEKYGTFATAIDRARICYEEETEAQS